VRFIANRYIVILRNTFKRNLISTTLTLFFGLLSSQPVQSQNTDTLTFTELDRTPLSFLLDDTYIIGGLNYGGLYYSNHFRQLHYMPGFNLGIEQIIPLTGRMMLSTGFHYAQRSFEHSSHSGRTVFMNHFIDLPGAAAFALPIGLGLNFRLILGANLSIRLASSQLGNYTGDDPEFRYDVNRFQPFDMGWFFGFSAEYKRLLARFRCYSGFARIDRGDQGMFNTVSIELGYYVFRKRK